MDNTITQEDLDNVAEAGKHVERKRIINQLAKIYIETFDIWKDIPKNDSSLESYSERLDNLMLAIRIAKGEF